MALENTTGRGVKVSFGPRVPETLTLKEGVSITKNYRPFFNVKKIPRCDRTVLSATNPAPLDVINNTVYGTYNYILYSSTDEGNTWRVVHNFGSSGGELKRIVSLSDGEFIVLSQTKIYRSINKTSWEEKIVLTEGNFVEWGIDGDGTNIIIVDYGVPHTGSNYLWSSTDSGKTFSRYEKNTLFPGDDAETHFHGVAYDSSSKRYYLNMGDSTYKYQYYSYDTEHWTQIPLGNSVRGIHAQATTISVFYDGLILGSDSGYNNGLFHILRKNDPSDEIVEVIWRWPHPEVSVRGFPFKNFYDENTGITFTCWRTDVTSSPPMITWCNGYTGGIFYEYEGSYSANDGIRNLVVLPSGKILAWVSLAGVDDEVLRFDSFSLISSDLEDTGNIQGGVVIDGNAGVAVGAASAARDFSVAVGANAQATQASSLAIGWNSTAGVNSTTIGTSSEATGDNSVVVGNTAKATSTANENVVIGSATTSTYEDSILIGRSLTNTGIQNVILSGKAVLTNNGYRQTIVGWLAESAGYQNSLVGRVAKATSNNGSGVGSLCEVGLNSSALGYLAKALLGNDVALGANTVTTLSNSVAIGNRDLHVQDATKGVILTSPNGTKYRITVDDAGALSTAIVS